MKLSGNDAVWWFGYYGRWTCLVAFVLCMLTWGINWNSTTWFLWGCGAVCVVGLVGMGLIVWSNVLRVRQENENRTW